MGGLIETFSISIVAPYAKCELGFSTTDQGLLLSAAPFGMVFTLQFWGLMADSYGRQKALRVCLIGGCLLSLASLVSYDIYSQIVLRFLAGAL